MKYWIGCTKDPKWMAEYVAAVKAWFAAKSPQRSPAAITEAADK